jgi:membrane-bound lytic murein transglycosylase D
MTYPSEHNLQPFSQVALPLETDTVAVQGPLPLSYFAQMIGMDAEMLALMNPQLKQKFVPAGYPEYTLHIPARLAPEFEKKRPAYLAYLYELTQSKVLAEQAREATNRLATPDSANIPYATWKYHQVRKGDNLGRLASQYRTTVPELRRINNLRSSQLQAGQRLKVQRLGGVASPVAPDTVAANSVELAQSPKETKRDTITQASGPNEPERTTKEIRSYRVRQGDTLWSISKKFEGVTVADLMKHNNLTASSKLTPGMLLKIQRG